MGLFVTLSIDTQYSSIECHYAECRYAECHYAECRYTDCRCAECSYAENHYAECRYTECRCAECRGTSQKAWPITFRKLSFSCPFWYSFLAL
jgi:hypothetical protein